MNNAVACALTCLLLLALAGCDKQPAAPTSGGTAAQPYTSAAFGGSEASDTSGGAPTAGGGPSPRADALLADAVDAFAGKTWLVIGDSLTEHNPRAEKNYHDYIAEWLGLEIVNSSTSGVGFIAGYEGAPRFLARIDSLPEQVDLITVFGGHNDFEQPLGSFGDGDSWSMYGAVNEFFSALIARYPNTPIGVFTPLPCADRWGEASPFAGHVNAIITTAGHYSLPVLDLYRESGLRPWNAANNLRYFSSPESPEGDGIHPNAEGQELLAHKMLGFILENLRPAA